MHIKFHDGCKDEIIYVDPVANLSTNDSSPRGWAFSRRRVNPWFLASRCAAKGENGLRFIPAGTSGDSPARPPPPSLSVLLLRRPLLTLYTSICYMPRSFVRRWTRGVVREYTGVISRRTRAAFSLPWLYLTSIIKINRPISYVKYYRRAFLNILSLSTFPRLPSGCCVPSFLFPSEQKGEGEERGRKGTKRNGELKKQRRFYLCFFFALSCLSKI